MSEFKALAFKDNLYLVQIDYFGITFTVDIHDYKYLATDPTGGVYAYAHEPKFKPEWNSWDSNNVLEGGYEFMGNITFTGDPKDSLMEINHG